jgi:RimJ/RimL family protein N-acetyltransferase
VANNLAEVDIVTLPNYRGMGLAKAATEAFIEQSIQQNIKANWDCFEENVASLKTAQSLGFEPIQTYWFLSIYNKNRDHEK